MHTHQSACGRRASRLFAGNEYAGLSQMALYYIGGLLKHAEALCAICNPTTNSYKRLVPGYEAPVNLAYSSRNRSAAIRIPDLQRESRRPSASSIARRIPAANPYLAFAALLMAGLDGVLNKIDPGEPLDKNIYELPPEELKKVPQRGRAAWARRWTAWRRTTSSCSRATCSRMDFLDMWISDQAQGARRLAPAPASLRVLPLLRRVVEDARGK